MCVTGAGGRVHGVIFGAGLSGMWGFLLERVRGLVEVQEKPITTKSWTCKDTGGIVKAYSTRIRKPHHYPASLLVRCSDLTACSTRAWQLIRRARN